MPVKAIQRMCAAACAAVVLPLATAQQPPPSTVTPASAVAAAEHTAFLATGWLTRLFELPADLGIDAGLREQATAMAQEHVQRMATVFREWMKEEASLVAPDKMVHELHMRMAARYLNEVALWRLESPGADHDRVMTAAWLQPGICGRIATRAEFAKQVLLVQAMPTEARQLALKGEQALLARWGTPRPKLPERPTPSAEDQAEQAMARVRAGQRAGSRPMVPALANAAVAERGHQMSSEETCALYQWWLGAALAEPNADVERAVTAYRYAVLPTAQAWFGDRASAGLSAEGYPKLAASYGVEGVVGVAGSPSEKGLVNVRIVSRKVTVPGIRGVRPVAFETMFDGPSLDLAAKIKAPGVDASAIVRQEIEWNLQ